ncbi:hypothetical protein AB6A40_001133 [Gnathostoma spinigerum]|uniref:Alpha/beta hydrolase fold-3 domain-containing protein n=1 Tax=Gnathostoma spinigerum TaxID=75299 RepID=A0ABD6E8D6_9BILA
MLSSQSLRNTSGTQLNSSFVWALIVTLLLALYQPFPSNFTDSTLDRAVMHVMEIFLRITYVYPGRLCPNMYCQVRLTRAVLKVLAHFLDPFPFFDSGIDVENTQFDSIKVRIYIPRGNRSSNGAVLFLHGGGFVIGDVDLYHPLTEELARLTQMVVVSVDYRLAPEHVFPTGLRDCERALHYLTTKAFSKYNVDPTKIVAMGDSAGGALVAAIAQRQRNSRKRLPKLKAQVLIYPLLQFANMQLPSYLHYYNEMQQLAFLDPELVAFYYLMYAGVDVINHPKYAHSTLQNCHLSRLDREKLSSFLNLDDLPPLFRGNASNIFPNCDHELSTDLSSIVFNPDIAPMMRENLEGLPNSLVVTCGHDILRDEGILYAKRLTASNVHVTWKHFPTGFHAMLNFYARVSTANSALKFIADWTRQVASSELDE